ncbi:C4-dicarboxylate-binding periplasmic protein DctP [bioreactor metagenome]|uniref:C4-dicarboxylate-binding periplasmic protein DctP n=1 Tax=bioreactor metagenome TaxID=1076179 RepID=A0A644VWL9_9ZZZZ
MKRILVFALACVMVLSLVACGTPKASTDNGGSKDAAVSTDIPKQTIKMAHMQPEGTPEDKAMKAAKAKIEELSGGNITVELYPAGQIGSIPESIQSVQMGVIQMCIAPCAIIASYCDDIALMDLPYLLPNDAEVINDVMNGDTGREMMDRLDSVGIHGMGVWFAGFREMTSNTDINSVADMKGLKMRIMESNILSETYNALGAQPIVVAYSETYNALANGAVSAQENPAQSTYTMNFYEVQKYIVETYHDAQVHILLSNKAWWDGLDDATKEIMVKAEEAGRAVLNEELPSYTQDCIDKMVKAGCTYHKFTDEQIAEFKEATAPVYDKFLTTSWRQDFVPRLQTAFADAVAKKG